VFHLPLKKLQILLLQADLVPPGNQFAIVIYFCNLLFIIYFGNLFGKLFWIFFLFFFLNFGSGFFWVKIYIIKKNCFVSVKEAE
jgi:hypothetical protein